PRLGRVDIRDRGGTARGVGPLPHALGALMQIVVRASIMFVFIFVIMRTMGRKELAQLSAFELILVIVMGDLIQQGVTQQDNSLTGAITAISTFVVWMLALSYLSFKSKRARTIIEGRPVIVIRDGERQEKLISD